MFKRRVIAAQSSFLFPRKNDPKGPLTTALTLSSSRIHSDDQALPLRSLPKHARVGSMGALFLAAVLGIHAGVMPRVAAAATANDGQAQTDNRQPYAGSSFGYPPNPQITKYSKEEEKAIGQLEAAFGRYSSACVTLFKPELIGLKGEFPVRLEVTENLRLQGAEGLLDPGSLAGAISEASILVSPARLGAK